MANKNLQAAKSAKNDEFHTQLSDIEKELRHYKEHFKGKTVLCYCDDPRVSNFFKYFAMNFEHLGLKRLITTCYKHQDIDLFGNHSEDKAVYLIYDGDKNGNGYPEPEDIGIHQFQGDGDFRSQECIQLLQEADIVVTNPPFSLFREYMAQLIKYEKKFLIIGNQNALSYMEVFPQIVANKVWCGFNCGDMSFRVPDEYEMRNTRSWRDKEGNNWRSIGNACWYTNLDHKKRHEPIVLYKTYTEKDYPEYDFYNAINVDKVDSIPEDYYGPMAVPLTFIGKYCPEQFEILNSNDFRKSNSVPYKAHGLIKDKEGSIKGTPKYVRILIRRKQNN